MHTLIVAGSPGGDPEVVGDLARRAEVVIAADSGAALCLRAGLRPDAVVGDLDSLDPDVRTALQDQGVTFMISPADKDVSDLDLALACAVDRGATRITATGVTGGRLDHTLAAMGSLLSAKVPVRFADPGLSGSFLTWSDNATYVVSTPGQRFSVIALEAPATVSITGARWPLSGVVIDALSAHGLSNIASDSGAQVCVEWGAVVILEEGGR